MAKISHREKVLLGYSPNSLSNFPSRRSSEVDFSDVFGGPPRRSISVNDFSNEFKTNSFDSIDDNVEADEGFRGPWLGLGEKPVFGDEIASRRRYPSEDFFDDIFRGDQPLSCSQSPRTLPRRDPFSSAPGSRVMSPARSLPTMVEPFPSPAKISLPARSTNTDFSASTSVNQSSNSPSPSISRFNQTVQNHDVSRADARLSYRPSPLSHQISIDGKVSTSSKNIDKNVDGPEVTKGPGDSQAANDITQFHFSIYKWPSKGVPLVMSLRRKSSSTSKENIKMERCLGAKGVGGDILMTEIHGVDIPVSVSLSFNSTEPKSPSGLKDRKHYKDTTAYTEAPGSQSFDVGPNASKSVSYSSLQDNKEQVCVDDYGLEDPREVPTLSKKKLGTDVGNPSSKSPVKSRKFNMRPFGSYKEEKKGNKTVIDNKGGKESVVKEREKPRLDDSISSRKVNKSKVQESVREAKSDSHKSDVAGKVHKFVKIFNQDSSSKTTKNVQGQSRSQSWRQQGTTPFEADNEVKSTLTEKHNETRASNVDWSATLLEDEISFVPGKEQFDVNSSGGVFDTPRPVSANESCADGPRDSVPKIEATPQRDNMDRKLVQEINIQSEVEYQEETQGYERKILQWSKGKEGNIRALLSTLQYVLWPNSGWKPVPLVDIIEANAVKRAYQKALLRLHPDKLQQKGAAPHQKFIAEKVFDILQEAWDHFNSIGSL